MAWSFRIARIAGIDVFLHWTFLILLTWIGASYLLRGESLGQAAAGIGFVLALFGCVVLHELGHALTARRFGIQTEDITLLPIGGVARLQRMPEDPRQEFLVAIAGPLVNLAIASVLFGYLWARRGFTGQLPETLLAGSFLVNLLWVNAMLFTFNLLPAFPMDGGRILRAFLATRMNYVQATSIAANVGQAMAMLLGLAGLFYNPFLIFIAFFVYLGAEGEARMVEMKSLLGGVLVRDAMIHHFRTLQPTDTLRVAADELLAGSQHDFPIVEGGRVVGMLRRTQLVESLAQRGEQATIETVMDREVHPVQDSDTLEHLSSEMQSRGITTRPVIQDDRLIGLVSTENIGEYLMIKAAQQRRAGA